ncbi:MAG: MotA/TolQ/ExbB proton channel family protein [Verrucomicrobiota bacterium]
MQNTASLQKSKSFWGYVAFVTGFFASCILLNALIVGGNGLIKTFLTLRANGGGDPVELAGGISVGLLTIFWGVIISLIFLIPCNIALNKYRKLRKQITTSDKLNKQEVEDGDGDAEEAV